MEVKTAPLSIKATGEGTEGEFEAYSSVFGNVDSYGDIVKPGAFARTLGEWKDRGDTIPILWGHDMADPFANIGGVLSAEEDEKGLRIRGQLDLDNPTAKQVYHLMKNRRTSRMSFAYAVRDSEQTKDGNELKDLDLFEVSVVQVPANDQAEILTVKAAIAGLKATDLPDGAADKLKQAEALLRGVLDSLEDDEPADDPDDAPDDAPGDETDAKNSGTEPDAPDAPDERTEQVKTGGHPDLALAILTKTALEGAQA